MKLKSIVIALGCVVGLVGCSSGGRPQFYNGSYFYVGDEACRSAAYDSRTGDVNCYNSDGRLVGFRSAMSADELQVYANYAAREQERLRQARIANYAQDQQTFNMAMGMVNQTQIGNLNTSTYQPIQQNDGTWIYCIRTSSYTVNCRAK